MNENKQYALIKRWRQEANDATTADSAVTYRDCADALEAALAVKRLVAICEGCGTKVRMPTKHAGKVHPDLPADWSQCGTSRYGRKGPGIRLAAWCPSCRRERSRKSPLASPEGKPE